MGCDIHCHIDCDNGRDIHHFAKVKVWRDYNLFSVMAGVRSNGISPVILPKGLPDKVSFVVAKEISLQVVPDLINGLPNEQRYQEGFIAESSVRNINLIEITNLSHKMGYPNRFVYHPDWHHHSWLTTEELGEVIEKYQSIQEHDFKYLYPQEDGLFYIPEGYVLCDRDMTIDQRFLKRIIGVSSIEPFNLTPPPEIKAIYASMSALEEYGLFPRLVFWFDN